MSQLDPGDVRKMGLGTPIYVSVVHNQGFGQLIAQVPLQNENALNLK